jgi:hypothetical protein
VGTSPWPQLLQKRAPGLFWALQLWQYSGPVATGALRVLCPQFVQKALAAGTSARQAGHCAVAGWETIVAGAETAATACAPSELPQCIQNAALAFTAPAQRGQVVSAGAISTTCTGAPHAGQNFFPVTSWPQCVQRIMAFPLDA